MKEKQVIRSLILFIIMVTIGLSMIITGFVVDKISRDNFVPETIYTLSTNDTFNKKEYYAKENDEYIKISPQDLKLYVKGDNDSYELEMNAKFSDISYYIFDESTNNYIATTPKLLNLYSSSKTSYKAIWYIYFLEITGALIFLLSFGNLHFYLQSKYNLKKMNVRQMSVIAIFSALSVVLYYFAKFKLPIFPSWLDIQFSDVPALLVSFMYGPVSGALTIIVRFFCKLPGTSTVGVGELADLIIGLTLVLIAGFIYKKHRSFKGALCAMGIGMVAATVMAMVSNWLILIPAYKYLAGFPQEALTAGMDAIISGGNKVVTDNNFMVYYQFVGVLPFNLLRYSMVFAITLLLYKRLHQLINFYAGNFKDQEIDFE